MAPLPADSLFIKAFGGNKQTTNNCNNVPAKARMRKKAADRWLYTKQVLQYSKNLHISWKCFMMKIMYYV